MEEADGAGDVFARGAANGRNAQRVSGNGDRRGQAGDTHRAIELRQARPELRTHVQACGQAEHENEAEQHCRGPREAASHLGESYGQAWRYC